jgi:tetratricopeptide (TPR) repeat protein
VQVVAAACAIAVLSAAATSARDEQQLAASSATVSLPSAPLTEEVYASTLARSASSENGQAILEASRWPARDLVPMAQKFRPATPALLANAVWLHLEAARASAGESARAQQAAAYAAVTRLVAMRPAAPDDMCRHGLLATIAALQSAMDVVGVSELVTRGLAVWPGEPSLLLARGALQETTPPPSRDSRSTRSSAHTVERRTALETALADYTAALAREPTLAEARLRRGRVLHRLGRLDEARPELERVRRESDNARLQYLAALFFGSLLEDAKRAGAAEAAYRDALSRYPGAQAPYLALANLRLRDGRTAAAQEAVTAMTLRSTQPGIADPRWAYEQGQAWDLERRLAVLRDSLER